jgi:hypothetical protein
MRRVVVAAFAACLLSPLQAQTVAPASAAGSATPAGPVAAPAADIASIPLEPGEGRKVASALADRLLSDFVIPANAKDYAAMLRANAQAGRYDLGTRGDLAKLLTDDLLAVHKDGHLHVELLTGTGEGGGRVGAKSLPPIIQSARWLAPGVAYIRPSVFNSSPQEIAVFKAFMEEHKNAKTIIFDLRNHHGGRLGEMDAVFPYLFASKTPLVKMEISRAIYDENGSPTGEAPTLEVEKGPNLVTTTHYAIPGEETPLRHAQVILLVSNATASAGEHFALAMKSSGRGMLIGESTAGANHFGGGEDLNEHFGVWMPIGRTYNIKTGKDWEGTGVAPDIAVDPKQALVVALEKAGLSRAQAEKLNAEEIPAEPVHKEKLAAR